MNQPDLFAPPEDRRCGTCVHRNARRGDELGACAPNGGYRAASAPPCAWWFGLEQLSGTLYDRRAA